MQITDFWLGVHPVTNGQLDAFRRAIGAARRPSARPELDDLDRPAVNVTWREALEYCEWAGGTLPSEAQWERAACGLDARKYPWGDASPEVDLACFALDWNAGCPSPVGRYPRGAGPFGCEDLAGNVWEWCLDAFVPDAHAHRPSGVVDPVVAAPTPVRPLRGGCWRSIDCKLQSAYRNWTHEVARHTTIGFRLCVTRAR